MKRSEIAVAAEMIKDLNKLEYIFNEVPECDCITITFKRGNRTRSGSITGEFGINEIKDALGIVMDNIENELIAFGVEE